MIEALVSFCQELVVVGGYPGVVLVAMLENFFPPLPSEAIFPFVGFVAAQGALSLPLVIASGVVGTFVGALFWYFAGHFLGATRLKLLIADRGKPFGIKLEDIERAERWFGRHETPVVFFARVVPLVRTFISVPAGFVKMNLIFFSFLTIAGSTVWISVLTCAGFILGGRWKEVVPYLESYELIIGAVVAGAATLFLLGKLRHRCR